MATAQERLTAIENKLLETDPSDVGTIELLKDEHARTRARVAPTRPPLAAPAGAAGAPTGSGKGGGERVADALGIAAMAIPKGLAGVADLGIFLGSKADKAMGLLDPNFEPPYLTPEVDKIADQISGRKIPQSIGRSVLEGVITAPLSGAKTAGGLAQAALAGGIGGGASEAVIEAGGHPLLAAAVGMGTGGMVQAVPQVRGLNLKEAMVESRLKHATKGIPESRLREAIPAHAEGRSMGQQLLPSQALDVPAPGLENLQGALLASRAAKAEPFIDRVGKQADWAQGQLRGLKGAGGQAPRDMDILAGDIKDFAVKAKIGERGAVNDATRPLFQAADAQQPLSAFYLKYRTKQIKDAIEQSRVLHQLESDSITALNAAEKRIMGLLESPRRAVTPDDLHTLMWQVRNDLPEFTKANGSPNNLARKRVEDSLSFMDKVIENLSFSIKKANEMQADLRGSLSNDFADMSRAARASGQPKTVLDNAMKQPEILRELSTKRPELLQELLSRTVRGVVDKALTPSTQTGLTPRAAGTQAKVELQPPPGQNLNTVGENLQTFLPALFKNTPNPQAAAEGFNRVLRVIDRASREPGSAFARTPNIPEAIARGTFGSVAQQVSEGGRQAGNYLTRFKDNATIDVLNRPDVMERLLYISKLPEGKVTQSLILSILPQFFEEGPAQ